MGVPNFKKSLSAEDKDGLVKGLRDMFRRKSACEGQITETLVLTSEINSRISLADQPEYVELKDLLKFLESRREHLRSQIVPIDQEIAATKDALRGTEY